MSIPVRTQHPGTPLRVLVCEDDPRLVVLTARLLEESGFVVDIATTVGQATTKLQGVGGYDIVLLDVHLDTDHAGGNRNGVMEALRQRQSTVPVVLTSGYPEECIDETLRTAPMVAGFVAKPCPFPQLVEALERAATRISRG